MVGSILTSSPGVQLAVSPSTVIRSILVIASIPIEKSASIPIFILLTLQVAVMGSANFHLS